MTHSDHTLSVTWTDFCFQRVQVTVLKSIPLRGSESIYTNNLQSQCIKNASGIGKPGVWHASGLRRVLTGSAHKPIQYSRSTPLWSGEKIQTVPLCTKNLMAEHRGCPGPVSWAENCCALVCRSVFVCLGGFLLWIPGCSGNWGWWRGNKLAFT